MADTPVLPQIPAVNAPAHTVAALNELAECLRSAVTIERTLRSDIPHFQACLNEHEECYGDLHAVLDVLASDTAGDAVTRFSVDMSQQMSRFMLCEDAVHQDWLFTLLSGFLSRAATCEEQEFADPKVTHAFNLILRRFTEFAPFHEVGCPTPSHLRDVYEDGGLSTV
jgi:hypothetical protein